MCVCVCVNNQQDALYRLIYYSKSALHVSDDFVLFAACSITNSNTTCLERPS